MRLRTLEDLKGRILPMTAEKNKPINQVSTDILREEAIKWIKEITSESKPTMGYGIITPDKKKHPRELYDINTVNWIKQFFNIEEEDLK